MTEDENFEIRVHYYFAPMISQKEIECIKFNIEQEQHYKTQQEEYELYMHYLELKLKRNIFNLWGLLK